MGGNFASRAHASGLLESAGCARALVDTVPSGVLVVDGRGGSAVVGANGRLLDALGTTLERVEGKRLGELLGCVAIDGVASSCGDAAECTGCEVQQLIATAVRAKRTSTRLVPLDLALAGRCRRHVVRVTAAPFEHGGAPYALVVLDDLEQLRESRRLAAEQAGDALLGGDPSIDALRRTVRSVARLNVPVLVQGESGVGKELVATSIHQHSDRDRQAFVAVDCCSLTESLAASELFGHAEGSFTGANRKTRGRFQLADGGTIFLDEIGEMPLPVQVMFLRVLQTGSFFPLGAEREEHVDVRVICASNRDLEAGVAEGAFRPELLYRLNLVTIHVPALRERRGDIPALAEHFLGEAAVEFGIAHPLIGPEVLEILLRHRWPGNVRELRNAMRYALIRSHDGPLLPPHLPPAVLRGAEQVDAASADADALRPELVTAALAEAGGNKSRAASLLQVSRSTLYRFLKRASD